MELYEIIIVHNYYRTIKQLISENKCLQWLCKGFSCFCKRKVKASLIRTFKFLTGSNSIKVCWLEVLNLVLTNYFFTVILVISPL